VNVPYCWHRPGKLHGRTRLCRHCGVAVEECACLDWGRSPASGCVACEESGWVAIVRSRVALLRQFLALD